MDDPDCIICHHAMRLRDNSEPTPTCDACAQDLLIGLLYLTDKEDSQGRWTVTLDYDNVHDIARVLDGDGNVIGQCGDISLECEPGSKYANQLFLKAIKQAITVAGSARASRAAADASSAAASAPPREITKQAITKPKS